MKRRHLLCTLLAAAALAGCSPLPTDAVAPRVSVTGLRITEISLLEQSYAVRLRIQNPNGFSFTVTGMDYMLEVNGREFAQGVSDTRVELAAYSEKTVEVEVRSSLAGLFEQLRSLDKEPMNGLEYRIHGHVSLEGFPLPIPFDHSAELLPSVPDSAPGSGTLRTQARPTTGGTV